jgi:aminoglycoside/choline kinase family phosphotransferase
MTTFENRLKKYLAMRGTESLIQRLNPDASTREYFRIEWHKRTAIACVYPEGAKNDFLNYLDVTRLFRNAGIPVAELYDYDESELITIQEDLGNRILRNEITSLATKDAENFLDSAISLIAKIQSATYIAYNTDSIAGKLRFDKEKLKWELDFFKTHFFETLLETRLDPEVEEGLDSEFSLLAEKLEAAGRVLCHRDFHPANLMIDQRGQLRVIDHQDARIGPASYDLVSLLLDRVHEVPQEDWVNHCIEKFLKARSLSDLDDLTFRDFAEEFELQAIQRCIKAIGTFSYQSAVRDKKHFLQYIRPMFEIISRSAGKFPEFRQIYAIASNQARTFEFTV